MVSNKYNEISKEIEQKIKNNEYKNGKLPTEKELCETYKVSRTSIRNALQKLTNNGLIETIQGSGIFIKKNDKRYNIAFFCEFGSPINNTYRKYSTTHIDLIIDAMEYKVRTLGYNLSLYFTRPSMNNVDKCYNDVIYNNVDGVIIFYNNDIQSISNLKLLDDNNIPYVLIDCYEPSYDTNFVVTNNSIGAYTVTRFLIEKGFKNMYSLSLNQEITSNTDRLNGFVEACSSFKDVNHSNYNIVFDSKIDTGDQAYLYMKNILPNMPKSFGIFSFQTAIMNGVLRAIKDAGLDYRDIGFAVFDGLPDNTPEDAITARVEQPCKQIAERSVEILLNLINNKYDQRKLFLEPKIMFNGTITPSKAYEV